MRNIRIVLWAVVIVLAGVVSWLTIEMTKTREEMIETAYGVPFELTAQTDRAVFRFHPLPGSLPDNAV
jgi:protein SCO1